MMRVLTGRLAAQLPRRLALSTALMPLERAVSALAVLRSTSRNVSFDDNMSASESKLDALFQAGIGNVPGALLRLMIIEAAEERLASRELHLAAKALDAFRHGLACVKAGGRAALTAILLAQMHQLLCSGAVSGTDGPARQLPAEAGSPLGDQMDLVMEDLERFLTDPPPLPLPLRLALVAGRIELASLFDRQSAQLAMLLMPLMAVADGQPPIFLAQILADRASALAALRDDGPLEDWICFFLERLALATDAAAARLQLMERLRLGRDAQLISLRSDSTARRLAELALGVPVLTVGAAQDMLGVSFQTANAAVATLVRLGILTPRSNIRRNRVFIVDETLTMLTQAAAA